MATSLSTDEKYSLAYFIAAKSDYCGGDFTHSSRLIFQNPKNVITAITEIVQELLGTTGNNGLFAVCCTGDEKWTNINIIQTDDGEFEIEIMFPDSFKEVKDKKPIRKAIKNQDALPESSRMKPSSVPKYDKESALERMKAFIKNLGDSSQTKERESTVDSNDILKLEELFNVPLRFKEQLEEILSLLKKIAQKDRNYILISKNLLMLSETLTKANFQFNPDKDTKDLRLEVIKLFGVFKDSPAFDQGGDISKTLHAYFQNNKDKYKLEMLHYETDLDQHRKNENAKATLIRTMERRLEYLINIGEFAPDLLEVSDFDDFIKSLGGIAKLEEALDILKLKETQPQQQTVPFTDNAAIDADFYKNAYNQRNDPSYFYQAEDFRTLQAQIFSRYSNIITLMLDDGKNKTNDYGIAYDNIKNAKKNLEEQLQGLSVPKLVYYNICNNHWVCFAALKCDGKVNILYKDSFGKDNYDLKMQIQEIFSEVRVNFVHNEVVEQSGGVDCGIFALENMRIMAEHLFDNEFIDNFASFSQFCKIDSAQKIRREDFAKLFVLGKYQEMIDSAKNLKKLETIRVRHFNEAEEIASKLRTHKLFQELQIIALKDDEELQRSDQNTMAIQIATNSGTTTPERESYSYYYHISFSKDFRAENVDAILSNVDSALGTPCDRGSRNFDAGQVNLRFEKALAQAILDDAVSIETVQISELLNNLYVPHNSADVMSELFSTDTSPPMQNRPDFTEFFINNLKKFDADQKEKAAAVAQRAQNLKEMTIDLNNKQLINAAIDIDRLIVLLEQKVKGQKNVRLSKKTLEVLIKKDFDNKKIIKALLNILNSCETLPVKVQKFSRKALSKFSDEDVDFVLEVKNLFDEKDLIDFAYKVVSTNKAATNKMLHLVKSYDLGASKYSRIFKFVKSYTNCKDFIANSKNRALLEEMVINDEDLPSYFVQDFKNHVKSLSVQDQLNSLKIGKFLIQNGSVKLEDFSQVQNWLDPANESLCDATLDIIYQETIHGRKLNSDIQAKIERIDNKKLKDKAKNILCRSEDLSDSVRLLSNPREEVKKRSAAIKTIKHSTPRIVSALVDIIKYEQDLRSDAFEALLKILPNEEVYSLNLEEIFHVVGSDISVHGLFKLAKNSKSVEQKKTLVNGLVNFSCLYTKTKEDSLDILSKIDEELLEARRLVFGVDAWKEIKNLRDFPLQIENLLSNIEENIARKFLITEDKILELIGYLPSGSVEIDEEIASILLSIDLHQGLTNTNSLYTALKNTELLRLDSISNVVVRDFCRGKEINPSVQELIQSGTLKLTNLIKLLYGFIARNSAPPVSLLDQISLYLEEENINEQNEIVELLSQVVGKCHLPAEKISPKIIIALKEMSLKIRKNHKDYSLNHAAFKCLEKIGSISRNDPFLSDYISSFKKRKFYKNSEKINELKSLDETEIDRIFYAIV